MKIREDFVTNSSSSSFVIMINEKFFDKEYEDEFFSIMIKRFLDDIDDYNNDQIKTEEEVLNLIKDQFGYEDDLQTLVDDESREQYKNYMDYLNKGFKIIYANIDDCSSFYYQLKDLENSNSKNVIVKGLG